jgi:glycine/D-amino acid oxidase-like deaminating enzyme
MLKVQPAKLARELRRVALELGVQIYEHSPVRTVEAGAGGPVVRTAAGGVAADQVVLAANVWMAHLPPFKDTVMVVSSDVVATDPIRDVLVERGLDRRPGGTNSSTMISYGGLTPDGRVYLGRGGGTLAFAARVTQRFDYSPSQADEVRRDFRYLYPELFDIEIPHAWSGAVDRSPSGLPRFGKLNGDDRIHYAIGYTGHGVSATSEAGHILASAVLRRDDHWGEVADLYLRAQGGVFPPEPVRYLAGRVVRKAVAAKDQTERAGREPSRLIKKLAGLAPATIADFGRRRSARQAPAG